MGDAFSSSQKQTTNTFIDRELRGQGRFALGEARNLYNDQTPLPSQYVGISPERGNALQQMLQIAQRGGVAGSAIPEWQKTISGAYLNPDSNPFLAEIVRRSVGAAAGAPVSGYASAGRFGSGAMANAVADASQATASRIYGANYMQERQNMLAALGLTGGMQELQYADPRIAGQVGLQYEQDTANQQAEALRQFQWPYAKLEQFQSFLTGNPLMAQSSSASTTTQPFKWGTALLGGIGGLMNPMQSMMPSGGE
jgi:hypothetical protein